jgi:hypothetical protein
MWTESVVDMFYCSNLSQGTWLFFGKNKHKTLESMMKYAKSTLKKPCRGFYDSQNILPTSFEIDQIQNIIDIGNWLFNFQEVE